jgi:hypothetical protein
MIFLETMHYKNYEENKGATFEGYTLLDQQTATKEKETRGRGSGGMLTFLYDETKTPIQVLKSYHHMPECIPIVITGKIKGTKKKGALLMAYYIKPEDKAGTYETIIEEMTKMIHTLSDKYHVILAGDGNAKLGDLVGDTRNKMNKAGARFLTMMEETSVTYIQPKGEGPHWTHYNVSKDKLRNRSTFDPVEATSIIDLVTAHADTRANSVVKEVELQDETHLSTDHVGLKIKIRAIEAEHEMLKPVRGQQAKKAQNLKAGTKKQKRYTGDTKPIIKEWLNSTTEDKLKWDSEEALNSVQQLIQQLSERKKEIAGLNTPSEFREKDTNCRGKKRKNLDEALRQAKKSTMDKPKDMKRNRTLWDKYTTMQSEQEEQRANEEQDRNKRRAEKTERAWKDKREKEK